MKAWLQGVLETLRLAAAVLLYTVLDEPFGKLIPGFPIIGQSLAAILVGAFVLVITWIIWPVSTVHVDFERYWNGTAYPGKVLDLVCKSNTEVAETYNLRVWHESHSLIGKRVAKAISRRGLSVSVSVRSKAISWHSEDIAAVETDEGITLPLNGEPPKTTWAHAAVTVDSHDMPAGTLVDVELELHLETTRWYDCLMLRRSNIEQINLMRPNDNAATKEGHR